MILPGLEDPTTSHGHLTLRWLPNRLTGLVFAPMFANTMTMTSSDVNTIAGGLTERRRPVRAEVKQLLRSLNQWKQ